MVKFWCKTQIKIQINRWLHGFLTWPPSTGAMRSVSQSARTRRGRWSDATSTFRQIVDLRGSRPWSRRMATWTHSSRSTSLPRSSWEFLSSMGRSSARWWSPSGSVFATSNAASQQSSASLQLKYDFGLWHSHFLILRKKRQLKYCLGTRKHNHVDCWKGQVKVHLFMTILILYYL